MLIEEVLESLQSAEHCAPDYLLNEHVDCNYDAEDIRKAWWLLALYIPLYLNLVKCYCTLEVENAFYDSDQDSCLSTDHK